jgi:hypothetical protein
MEQEYRRLLEALRRENPRGPKRIGFGDAPAAAAAPPVEAVAPAPAPAGAPALREGVEGAPGESGERKA